MRIEFTYARGPDHFVEQPRASRRNPSLVASYAIAVLLALAGIAFAIAAFVYAAPQAAACGLSGTLLGVLIAVAARQRGRTRFVMPPAAMEPRRWVVGDRGIEISGAGAVWEAFQFALELPHAYLFVMKDHEDKRTFDIPREPLSEADDAAVREVVTRHHIPIHANRPRVP